MFFGRSSLSVSIVEYFGLLTDLDEIIVVPINFNYNLPTIDFKDINFVIYFCSENENLF